MVDRDFELELERRFADAPAAYDPVGFAARVTARLDRNWTFRQMLIGGLGIAGGLIGAGQFLGGGLISQLAGGLSRTNAAIVHIVEARGALESLLMEAGDALTSGATLDSRIIMMSAALAVVAGALFVTRVIQEI